MLEKVYLKWEDINIKWEDLDMNWEDISILIEVANIRQRGSGDQGYLADPWYHTQKQLGKEKSEKFIKLLCRANNLNYEDTIKPNENIKITIAHIDKTLNESLKIKIKF